MAQNRDKEETGCQVPEGLKPCVNNCGFFGSPATMNLCSKCYNEYVQLNINTTPKSPFSGVSILRPEVGVTGTRSDDMAVDISGPSSSVAFAAALQSEATQTKKKVFFVWGKGCKSQHFSRMEAEFCVGLRYASQGSETANIL